MFKKPPAPSVKLHQILKMMMSSRQMVEAPAALGGWACMAEMKGEQALCSALTKNGAGGFFGP